MRSTLEVWSIVYEGNRALARPGNNKNYRYGICSMLEFVLKNTDNYLGYDLLPREQGKYQDNSRRQYRCKTKPPAVEAEPAPVSEEPHVYTLSDNKKCQEWGVLR